MLSLILCSVTLFFIWIQACSELGHILSVRWKRCVNQRKMSQYLFASILTFHKFFHADFFVSTRRNGFVGHYFHVWPSHLHEFAKHIMNFWIIFSTMGIVWRPGWFHKETWWWTRRLGQVLGMMVLTRKMRWRRLDFVAIELFHILCISDFVRHLVQALMVAS